MKENDSVPSIWQTLTLSDCETWDLGGACLLFMIDGTVTLKDGRLVDPNCPQDGDLKRLFQEATGIKNPEDYKPLHNRTYKTNFDNVRIIPMRDILDDFFLDRSNCLPNFVGCVICGTFRHKRDQVGVCGGRRVVHPGKDDTYTYYYCQDCDPGKETE